MMAMMLRLAHDDEVLQTIIRRVSVDVMNVLVGAQTTTDLLLDDEAVAVRRRAVVAPHDPATKDRVEVLPHAATGSVVCAAGVWKYARQSVMRA